MNVVLGLVNPQKEPNCMFEMNALSYKLTFSVENNVSKYIGNYFN